MTNLTVKIPPLKIPQPLLSSGANGDQNRDEEERLVATADSYAFKFLEEAELRFQCSIMLIPRTSDYSPIEVRMFLNFKHANHLISVASMFHY